MILIIALAVPAMAQRGRRSTIKDPNALLSSARIALLDKNPRYEEAMDLCNQALEGGPVPEAYFQRANIYAEYVSKEYDPSKRIFLVDSMVINYDSVIISCDNKDVKKKYRKNCKKFAEKVDSAKVYFWRDNYKNGVELISRLDDEYLPAVKNAVDSSGEADAKIALESACDSAKYFFQIAYTIDKSDYRTLEGIGIIFDRLKMLDSSAYWFEKAHEVVPEEPSLVQNIAYAHIQLHDWEKAIEWFGKYIELVPTDLNALMNIAICFNNVKMYDSSYVYNMKAIELDSTSADAYLDIGQYFLLRSTQYSDSIVSAQQNKDEETEKKFITERDANMDSSAVYFSKVLDYDPENLQALEQYGLVVMIRGDFEKAIEVFTKLTEFEPFRKDHWVNIGDAQIQLQDFCGASEAFAKATEIDPGDIKLWETLADLYQSCDQPDKSKEARDKAEELKKGF
jgi:tetratricopeptide (TPR) repeat protein